MKPLASVSLDADNLWSYLKSHGEASWREYPSYHPLFMSQMRPLLDQLGIRITFFIVAADLERAAEATLFRELVNDGHDVGNHSYHHEPWLHRYSSDQLRQEIERAHEAISMTTGLEPFGFRGPGFSWSADTLEVLADLGYQYDSSTFPTFIGPLARAFYLRSAKLTCEDSEEREFLYGSWKEGLRPNKPYSWKLTIDKRLVEIPVTTMPLTRTPFHLNYLIYLARKSDRLMMSYLRAAIVLCKVFHVEPTFLLHPLDILGGEDVKELGFFPGMDLPRSRKQAIFMLVMQELAEHFELLSLNEHISRIVSRGNLAARSPLPRFA